MNTFVGVRIVTGRGFDSRPKGCGFDPQCLRNKVQYS